MSNEIVDGSEDGSIGEDGMGDAIDAEVGTFEVVEGYAGAGVAGAWYADAFARETAGAYGDDFADADVFAFVVQEDDEFGGDDLLHSDEYLLSGHG